ncbi:MAG: MOP flippase family protein [Cyclobacteriaceae bacterium]|nr:MOP flippase family protein [Cyclobacteriaceae bacterium]
MASNGHKQKTVTSLKWNVLSQLLSSGTTILVTLILMKILGPEAFGLVGMVTVISGMLMVFKNLGLTTSLIQKKDINEVDKDTVFWISVALGISLALLLIAGSNPIAKFYNEPELKSITVAISSVFFFDALGSVHLALLQKNLFFKKIFFINTISVMVGGGVAIYMAFNGYGVWAIVVKQISTSVIVFILLWILTNWNPSFNFSRSTLNKHLSFSLPLLGNQIVNYWIRNADNFLIGKFIGTQALGNYSRAYSLMLVPVSQISGSISRVMFPSFSLIQDEKEKTKLVFLKMTKIIALITFPLMMFLHVAAEPIVLILIGEKWVGSIQVIKTLAFLGAIQSIGTLVGNIFLSQGATKIMFKVVVYSGLVLVTSIIVGLPFGINGVALCYLLGSLVVFLPQIYIMGKLINLSLKQYWYNIQFVLLTNIIFISMLLFIQFFILRGMTSFINLLILMILAIISYPLLLWVFHKKEIEEVKLIIKG